METSRIKIKIGEHEFEAEGPADSVKEQFEAFKEIISSYPRISQAGALTVAGQVAETKENTTISSREDLGKILHADGRIVSLTAIPASSDDAALLIILGHKELRENGSVTGQEIGDGLAQSGRKVLRVDRVMEKALEQALVLKTGIKRATRYRLTNQGLARARELARELISTLP
jgi:hypothetical protein